MTDRVCSRIGCGNPLDGARKDARYCSPRCRRLASRQRAGVTADPPVRLDWSALALKACTAVQRGRQRYSRRGSERA